MRAAILGVVDKCNSKRSWWIGTWILKWAVLVLALTAWSIVMYRAGGVRAAKRYEEWKVRYVDDYLAQQEAAKIGIPPAPAELLLNQQSEALARVLYGVKDNSENDLKTYCWCVFNRVDNPLYPETLEEVIAQPKQWMAYSEDNPVLDSLYKIAREQIELWQNGRRPVSDEFIYMTWTPSRITLRNAWRDDGLVDRWKWGDSQ